MGHGRTRRDARAPRRARLLVAVAAVAALLPVGVADAGTDDGGTTRQQLRDAQDRLAGAESDLAGIRARIEGVQAEVARADQQLATVSARLTVVEQELVEARAEAAAAEAALADARRRLATLDEALRVADRRAASASETLDAQAARMWMRGPGSEAAVLLRGLGSAADVHDVAVVGYATSRQLDLDRAAEREAVDAASVAADSRAVVDAERDAVRSMTIHTQEARAAAETLAAEQRALVAEAEQQRAARADALARLEQDAAARAVLVADLSERVEQLRAEALQDWLREADAQVPAPSADVDIDQLLGGEPPAWAARLPSRGRPLAAAVDAAAAASGIDGPLFAALVWTESGFDPGAVSPAGAIGLTQLMPPTAAELGVDPWDPGANLLGGARYLRAQLDRFGRVDLALAAYNAGPGRVERAGRAIPDIVETQLYVLRVLDRVEQLRAA